LSALASAAACRVAEVGGPSTDAVDGAGNGTVNSGAVLGVTVGVVASIASAGLGRGDSVGQSGLAVALANGAAVAGVGGPSTDAVDGAGNGASHGGAKLGVASDVRASTSEGGGMLDGVGQSGLARVSAKRGAAVVSGP
jgi:hypothetical protein